MKKRFNIIFFSICFLAALIAEAYCILVLDGDLFSVIGIGAVVLITVYLLMDSIRSKLVQSSDNIKSYVDRVYSEEAEKWSERYTELLNIQKATYTATKKNTALISEQFEEIVVRMETLEANNAKSMQKLIELQMKALEGQKNALNLEINYGKENTKQLMNVLREEGSRLDQKEELSKILSCLEDNNSLLKEQINKLENSSYHSFDLHQGTRQQTGFIQDTFENEEETFGDDFYKAIDTLDQVDMDTEPEALVIEGMDQLAEEPELIGAEEKAAATVAPAVVPLYDDPNKALSADEIAALFATFGQ
jgi:hypothetical protein